MVYFIINYDINLAKIHNLKLINYASLIQFSLLLFFINMEYNITQLIFKTINNNNNSILININIFLV